MIEKLEIDKDGNRIAWDNSSDYYSADSCWIILANKMNKLIDVVNNLSKWSGGSMLEQYFLSRPNESNNEKVTDNPTPWTEPISLPQKIRLLADFAGYPAGEYEYTTIISKYWFPDKDMYVPVNNTATFKSNFFIHPDIIKATSWQGIRSEVTDGEESLSRTKEYTTCYGIDCPWCKHCEPSTPQTEPIESIPCTACYGKKQYTQLVTKNYGDEVNEKLVNELADCKRCDGTGIEPTTVHLSRPIENSIPISPPLESKYEECAKEMGELAFQYWCDTKYSDVIEKRDEDEILEAIDILKKYF